MTEGFSGDRIILKGLAFYGFHGVLPEEAKLGQRFYLDLICGLDLGPAGRSDELQQSVSYAAICKVAETAFGERRFNLIEALGQHVVDRLFDAFEPIRWIQIRIRKPSAPIPMASGEAAVELHRYREDR